jgi:hypothetical protein
MLPRVFTTILFLAGLGLEVACSPASTRPAAPTPAIPEHEAGATSVQRPIVVASEKPAVYETLDDLIARSNLIVTGVVEGIEYIIVDPSPPANIRVSGRHHLLDNTTSKARAARRCRSRSTRGGDWMGVWYLRVRWTAGRHHDVGIAW